MFPADHNISNLFFLIICAHELQFINKIILNVLHKVKKSFRSVLKTFLQYWLCKFLDSSTDCLVETSLALHETSSVRLAA